MKTILQSAKSFWKAGFFSPQAFVGRAVVIALLYAVSRLAGLQEYTTFLSGTSGNVNMSWQTAASLGLLHLALYFAFILLAPIFLITAGLLAGWNCWRGKREKPLGASPNTTAIPSHKY